MPQLSQNWSSPWLGCTCSTYVPSCSPVTQNDVGASQLGQLESSQTTCRCSTAESNSSYGSYGMPELLGVLGDAAVVAS